jgi:hypothetical protein
MINRRRWNVFNTTTVNVVLVITCETATALCPCLTETLLMQVSNGSIWRQARI